MTPFRVRAARAEELEEIAACWARSFGDGRALILDMIESGGMLEHAVVAEADGRARGAFFCFDGLGLGGLRAGYLYALCVLPEYREHGIGAALCREAARRCLARGADIAVLAPGGAGLERWYRERLGMRVLCRAADVPVSPADVPGAACVPVGFEEYAAKREGRSGAGVPLSLLAAQDAIFRHMGGGFFRAGDALACAEPRAGGVLVRELLCAPEERDAALSAVSRRFGGARVWLRQAADEGQALLYQPRPGLAAPEGAACPLPFPLD